MGRLLLHQQICRPIILFVILSLTIIGWYTITSVYAFFVRHTIADLQARAELISGRIVEPLADQHYHELFQLCREMALKADTRITVVLPGGKVVEDTSENPNVMDNHADREELVGARESGFGSVVRYSNTLRRNMIYVAIPIRVRLARDRVGGLLGFVRVSVPIASIGQTFNGVFFRVVMGLLLLAVAVTFIAHRVSHSISRPLEQMRLCAGLFASGRFEERLPLLQVKGLSVELASLRDTLNNMACQLEERIKTVTSQRNQLEAVFAGMQEVVIVLSSDQCVVNVNQAAEKLLGVSKENMLGKTVLEIIRNHNLQKFITSTLEEGKPVEEEIVLRDDKGDMYLLGHGSCLVDEEFTNVGALIVFNDITKLRKLETVRRDFVANVSHELRTPITTIKGFVETLNAGAINEPQDASRFFNIITNNVNRLSSIIDDLLTLSRLELHGRELEVTFKHERVYSVILAAKEACEPSGNEKKLSIKMSCPFDLEANINAPLLEQALVNLIGNAIKYSHEKGEILIEAIDQGENVVIQVIDHGCGIAAVHLPRIFERFYRSDKARSRKEGGTGLGLSIVRHIVEDHGGAIKVSTTLDKGSVFSLSLPLVRSIS